MPPRQPKLPIDAVKFVDSVKVLVAKVKVFFAYLGVSWGVPEFDNGLDGPFALGPFPTFEPLRKRKPVLLGEVLGDVLDKLDGATFLGQGGIAFKGKEFDKVWVDDVGVKEEEWTAPAHNTIFDFAAALKAELGESALAAVFASSPPNPNEPDVMLDPFINHDPATGAVTAYGFRCRGRGLPRVHKIVIDREAADHLAALAVRDGRVPWHYAKQHWDHVRRNVVREHAANLILPIAAAFKKSQQKGA